MLPRQALAVHGVDQQRVGMERAFERQATLICDRTVPGPYGAVIGAHELDLPHSVSESGRTKDPGQWRSRPLGRADRPIFPRLTLGRWVEGYASIAGTFQCCAERSAW